MLDRYEEARTAYERVVTLNPHDALARIGRGNAFLGLKRYDEASVEFEKALELSPELHEALVARGNLFYESGRYDEALAAYDRVSVLHSESAAAWLGRGNALTGLARYDEASAAFDRALELSPKLAESWVGHGNVLVALKSYDEALSRYDNALALKPELVKAWMGRGHALSVLNRYDQAIAAYDQVLTNAPNHLGAVLSRAQALLSLKRYDEAIAAFDKALEMKPDLVSAWLSRARVCFEFRHYEDAFVAYDKVIKLDPNIPSIEGYRLLTKMYLCDWNDIDNACRDLLSSVRNDDIRAMPFVLLGIKSSASDQFRLARRWAAHQAPAAEPLWRGERYEHDRIRLVYLSADFRDHPVSYLLAGIFEQRDRARFEVVGLSINSDNSEIQKRITGSFDRSLNVAELSDARIAELILELQADILIDLGGLTDGGRSNVMARRPAPIQVNYLGYPGTIGADYIDYIIGDRTVIPETQREFYAEKVVYLPDTYLPTDFARKIAERRPQRADCKLPDSGVVFCSFNNNFKITPQVFDVWMRLLRQVDGSVLWLTSMNESAASNLRNVANSRGVNPERIIFAERVASNEDHLGRLHLADLALDTFPYTGHTTTSDALWCGLPVLTCQGETFAARVAASLLQAIRLPELVTTSLEAYEQTALDLATNPEKLRAVRRKLSDHRLTTPLFNTRRFTTHIESAFVTMYERHMAGRPPDHFAVET
jgi:predicted O-linked N-acetylglucosamine transferase (SPINDLY family)